MQISTLYPAENMCMILKTPLILQAKGTKAITIHDLRSALLRQKLLRHVHWLYEYMCIV